MEHNLKELGLEAGNTVLPNVVYYNDDHSNTPACTVEMGETLKLTFSAPSTWHELVAELEAGAKYLSFHADMIERSAYSSPRDFIDAIRTICRFIPASRDLRIAVVVKPTTPMTIIHALQQAGCQGLVLDLNYWTAEEAAAGGNALLNGIQYWPRHILDQLPSGLPVSVYFRGDVDGYVNPVMLQQLRLNAQYRLHFSRNWDELADALKNRPHQLVFHISMLTRLDLSVAEIVDSIKTKMKLFDIDIPIGVGFEPETPLSVVKELKRAGVFGLVPSAVGFGTVETVTGLNALAKREPYWPKHLLDQLPGAKKKTANTNSIVLTTRQDQVFRLIIERGASNKVIARSIGISESTVKLHLTEIFKKYGVRNRTQLAVFSHAV